MAAELVKPRVTEIQVRIDCNGCVQKIKKALHGINGIYDLYIDLPQQKLTIIGWADPEKIVKAIRKTRKIFTVCSHVEQSQEGSPEREAPPAEGEAPPAEGEAPPPPTQEANTTPPPPETPQAEQAEPPKDRAPAENAAAMENPAPAENPAPLENPPPTENPPPEVKPSPIATDINADANSSTSKDIGEPDYGYRYFYGYGNGYGYPSGHGFHHEVQHQQAAHVTHSYNTHNPSPYVTEYARSPPRQPAYSNGMMDHYSDYYSNNYSYQYTNSYANGNGNGNGNGNFTSMFSDENPNACSVM